jgi:hypothetical protein
MDVELVVEVDERGLGSGRPETDNTARAGSDPDRETQRRHADKPNRDG